MRRTAIVPRKTKETEIIVKLNIDGTGKSKINTGIGFLDHMLELFSFWGFFDLEIKAKNCDLKVDIHHTNEDIGLVLGQAFKKALGKKLGIKRIGYASVTMEETVAFVSLDICGRGFSQVVIGTQITPGKNKSKQDVYSLEYLRHFLEGFANQLGMNLNITINYPTNDIHATLEPLFKALGVALDQATQIDIRRKGVPSTKGVID